MITFSLFITQSPIQKEIQADRAGGFIDTQVKIFSLYKCPDAAILLFDNIDQSRRNYTVQFGPGETCHHRS